MNCIEISCKSHGEVAACSGLKSVSFLGLRARVFHIWLTESWQQVATDCLSWTCMTMTLLRRLDKTAQKSVSSSFQFISQFLLHRTFLFRDPQLLCLGIAFVWHAHGDYHDIRHARLNISTARPSTVRFSFAPLLGRRQQWKDTGRSREREP